MRRVLTLTNDHASHIGLKDLKGLLIRICLRVTYFSAAVRDLAARQRGKDATDLRPFPYLLRRPGTGRSSAKHIGDG